MWFSEISIENIKSFEYVRSLDLSRNINILIGPNNSGKSTILNLLLILQHQNYSNLTSDTYPIKDGSARIVFEDIGSRKLTTHYDGSGYAEDAIKISISKNNLLTKYISQSSLRQIMSLHNDIPDNVLFTDFPQSEPDNLIYPFLARRKTTNYIEEYTSGTTKSVIGDHRFLYSKIQRLTNPSENGHELFQQACKEIFGHAISTQTVEKGIRSGYQIGDDLIPITAMGEGVPQLLGFIVDLCRAKDKVFIVEEPENDIHPKALKALLKLIEQKSADNQFFISTHSNIVVKYLGALPTTKLFKVTMELDTITKEPRSTMNIVDNSEQERGKVLEELGYEFYDYGLWEGWLLLEESSAEKIINQFLIPMFVPELQGRLRTISANSTSQVEAKFSDFHRLFTFLHLEPIYQNKAWVIIDGGVKEATVIQELKEKFKSWPEGHFQQFDQHDFEKYYPQRFEDKITEVLSTTDKQEKRKKKKELLDEVVDWAMDNKAEAKIAFEISAKEVIEKLNGINSKLSHSIKH